MLDTLVPRVVTAFGERFGSSELRLFAAPGRVNLIGGHTDYNDGFVLPVAIDRHIALGARTGVDGETNLWAVDLQEWDRFDMGAIASLPEGGWRNYTRGVLWALQQDGHSLLGIDGVFAGDVPQGAGLSSSAAILMATGFASLTLSGLEVDRVGLALAGQRAEHEYVGTRCGIMDQFASSLGRANHALLIDCRGLSAEPVPLPPEARLVVADSNVHRGLAESLYNERREQCEAAAARLGVAALRDIDEETLEARAWELEPVIRRRARHVVTENARVLRAAEALRSGDLAGVGELMKAAHASLRDDFEISCRELDLLVEIASGVEGVYGARMTGGGFGGSVVVLVHESATERVASELRERYPAGSGLEATVHICQTADGVEEVS